MNIELTHRNSQSLDSIAEIYASANIHHLINKYSNPTNKKERKNYKSILKRIVDYHITQLLNPLTTETVTQLFWFLKEYFEKGDLFSYSSINLIFQNFLDNKKTFQLLYLDCEIVLDAEVPKLENTTYIDTTTDTRETTTSKTKTVQVRQSIHVVKYILDFLLTKSTYSNITCNQKFTKLITEFFHWNLTTYFNNKNPLINGKEVLEYILKQFKTGLQLLVESNIYLDNIYITQLCEIYNLLYIHHLNNNNDLLFGIITTLFKYINTFILSIKQYNILSKNNTYYCNKERFIEYDVLYIPYECSLKISHLKDKIFAKLKSNQISTKQSKVKKQSQPNSHLPKVWTSTIHNAISYRFLGGNSKQKKITISNIVDGRNMYYDNYKSDEEHKLNLSKFENDVVKWISLDNINLITSSQKTTMVVFNCRHYNIIKKSLTKILSRFINNCVNCKDNIYYDKDCDNKNNYKVRTIKNYLDINKHSRHISISKYNKGACVFIFTPRGVDDDIMSIYLKLTYPTASINTSDTYGKYGELIHNNHYCYTLWCKLFNI